MAGAISAVIIAVILAVAGVFSGDESSSEVESGFGSITTPEPGPPPPQPRVRRYEVGGRPDSISAGAGYVWTSDSLDGTLRRINPESKRPISVEVAGFPTDVSAAEDAAWLALADRGAIQRASGTEGAGEPVKVAGFPFQIAAGEGSVWAMSQTSIERIDPETQETGETVELDQDLASIAAGEGGLWVVRANDEVLKLDPGTGRSSESAQVPGAFNVTVGESAVWALGAGIGDESGGTLTRIDPAGSVAGDSVPVVRAVDVAAGLGFVWVLDAAGKLTRYDPATGLRRGDPISVGDEPLSVSVGEGAAWVAATGEGAVYRVTP